ncbi:MAG: F0F1 ATP synthase subunit B [Rhodospirillales bacterium]|nr:MAG: F0F1 ATP synthase subunit B [Rhodospirillales bacterium]
MISAAYASEAGAGHAAVSFWQAPEFWVAIAFAIMVGAALKPLSRAIASALDIRAEKIKNRIDEANKLKEDAQEMLSAYQRKQREALKEAEDIVAHAKAEAERLAKQAAKDLEDSLKRREQQAVERIAQAEAKAVKEVRDIVVDIAIEAAEKAIAGNLPAAAAQSLIDGAIKDIGAKLN